MFDAGVALRPEWLIFACGVAFAAVMARRRFRSLGERARYCGRTQGGDRATSSTAPTARPLRPQFDWERSSADKMSELESQKAELYELAREARGKLDARIVALEQLISASDRQISRMEQLLEGISEKSIQDASGPRASQR